MTESTRDLYDEIAALRAELDIARQQLDDSRALCHGHVDARDLEAARAEIEALKGARLMSVLFGHHEGAPKPFALQWRRDRKLVALGAEFPDGAVALRLGDDCGWTTKSGGGAEQFNNASIEILWLSDEVEPLAEMEAERDRLRTAARHVVDCYRNGNLMGTVVSVDRLGEVLDGGT